MSTGTSCHFGHICFKNTSLMSGFIQFLFMILYHVYSHRSGADNPKILMSTETSCYFGHLLQVSKKISLKSLDFIQFFS